MPWSGIPASVNKGSSFTATWIPPSIADRNKKATFSVHWLHCNQGPGGASPTSINSIGSGNVRITVTPPSNSVCSVSNLATITAGYFDSSNLLRGDVSTTFRILDPTITAPSATLRGVNNVLVNGSLFPSISLSGGDYDSVTHSWSAVGGSIRGTDSSAIFTASGTHNFSASITWSGTFKKSGASDVTISRTARFSVTAKPIVLPAASLTGVEDLKTGDSFTASISLLGGDYNTVFNRWTVSPSAAGTLNSSASSATFTAGDTAHSRVTLTWTGTFGRPGATTRTLTRSGTFAITKPVFTVNGPDSINTGEFGTYTVTSSESLAGAIVTWSTDPPDVGTINSSGSACTITPDDIIVSSGIAATKPFSVIATVTSDGETFTPRKTSSVIPNPPNVVLPTVAVSNVSNVEQGQTLTPTVTITGGVYDEVEHDWIVDPTTAGSFNDVKLEEPVFTANTFTSPQTFCIGNNLTFKGTGTKAYNNTFKETSPICNRYTITTNTAVAPSIELVGVKSVVQGDDISLTLNLTGGIYDPGAITYLWEVVSDEREVSLGTFDNPRVINPTFTGASTTQIRSGRIKCTVTVTRSFQGNTTTASVTESVDFKLLVERTFPILDKVRIVGEKGIAIGGIVQFSIEVSGNSIYDGLAYEWSVNNSIFGSFDDVANATPKFTTKETGDPTITCRVLAVGTNSNAKVGLDPGGRSRREVTYSLKIFNTEKVDTLTTGAWREIPEPGTPYILDKETLPIIAEYRQGEPWQFGTEILDRGTNTLRTFWDERPAGNLETVPNPSFIDRAIKDMNFTQNRLVFLTTDTVSTSFAGLHGLFFGASAQGTIPADPIDLDIGNSVAADCITSQGPNLWIFTPEQQFALYPADVSGGWTPENMRIDKMAQIAIELNLRIWSDGQIVCAGHPNGLLLDLSLDLRGIQPLDISARCPDLLNKPTLTREEIKQGKYQWKKIDKVIARCFISATQTQIALQRSKEKDELTNLYPTRLLITRQVGETFCWSHCSFEEYDKTETAQWSFKHEIMSITQHQENLYLLVKDEDNGIHLESLYLGDNDIDEDCCDHRGAEKEITFTSCLRFSAPVFFENSFGQLAPVKHTQFQCKSYTIHYKPKLDKDDKQFDFDVISIPNGCREPVIQKVNNRKLGFKKEDFLESPLPEFDSITIPCDYEARFFNICVISRSQIPFEILGGEWNCYISGPEERRRRAN